ncbi:MAG: SsrA-binding protein SmpB [Chitinophagaceae bacterium]|nr:SsrA-binding protein SmpB [Chitinophagaceae bacterium]
MTISLKNKKAHFNYQTLQEFDAGIVLFGCEVKSIIKNGVSFSDSYCIIKDGEIFIKNLHISRLSNSDDIDYIPTRDRKLLLTKKEIRKMSLELKNRGLTIVPLLIYTNKTNLIKIKIAIVKGKKKFDKRETIKKRDIERDIRREE